MLHALLGGKVTPPPYFGMAQGGHVPSICWPVGHSSPSFGRGGVLFEDDG